MSIKHLTEVKKALFIQEYMMKYIHIHTRSTYLLYNIHYTHADCRHVRQSIKCMPSTHENMTLQI
jgi:hypothetical protein